AEAKPLGSPEHCTSGASSPRFSDGRFAVGEDGHRHGGRALWTPLAPVVCGDCSYRHRRYDHFTLSLRQGCAPDDIPLRYRCDGTRVGVQRTAHGKSCLP
ncbi:unnamed protein product, partial [Pylaiella littoralis]